MNKYLHVCVCLRFFLMCLYLRKTSPRPCEQKSWLECFHSMWFPDPPKYRIILDNFSIKIAFIKFSMLKYFHLQKMLVCQKAESFLKASRSWPNRFKTVSGPPPPRDYSIIWNLFSVFSCRPQRRRVARIAYLECFEKWKAWIT